MRCPGTHARRNRATLLTSGGVACVRFHTLCNGNMINITVVSRRASYAEDEGAWKILALAV